jgi:hypothetical protein
LITGDFETVQGSSRLHAQFLLIMKTDHTFTFTAAVILAGVALAFVNPADATDKPLATINTLTVPANAFAAVDANAGSTVKRGTKRNHSCVGAKRAERPTSS